MAGLRSRVARNADELVQTFEAGCGARDHGYMDLGSVHERAAAIFTIRLAQFSPAADAEDEDAATVCKAESPLSVIIRNSSGRARKQFLHWVWSSRSLPLVIRTVLLLF